MAELHDSLKYLGPTAWSSVPTSGQALENYLADLFSHAQIVLDSVPLPSPEDAPLPSKAQPHGQATKASEVTLSSERSAPPPFGHEKYQKDWGKPMKMKASENPLGLSVYKMSGKDSKGSWFARRSVHEGIGYNRFKRSLQIEFEKSLAEVGPPGTGNVRGIGGEERVEQVKGDRGTVEVYRLSAQFPGPTAARDFVTMLTTSDRAMQVDKSKLKGSSDSAPRHYMIISKPCDHPQTQPRSGFVRGYYESVEFIREVPRKLKSSQSALDLDENTRGHQHKGHHHKGDTHLSDSELHAGRKRASTVDVPSPTGASAHPDPTDPEDNPVEWMMITRSDPGGGIPRFLVERGTPSSICSDAVKFVDWACQNEDEPTSASEPPKLSRKESRPQSWRSRSLVGIEEHAESQNVAPVPETEAKVEAHTAAEPLSATGQNEIVEQQVGTEPQRAVEQETVSEPQTASEQPAPAQGLFGTAAATLRPYAPQMILNHLPGTVQGNGTVEGDTSAPIPTQTNHETSLRVEATLRPADDQGEARSIKSNSSFVSAEDHWSSEPEEADSSSSTHSPQQAQASKETLQHEDELKRLDSRKDALHKKFADTQAKYEKTRARQNEEVQGQTAKAQEKHEREMKKHEEKYKKELAKVERKKEKEQKKMEAKMKKHAEKDDKVRLTRERDEARQELDLAKKEAESLRHIVAELQKENTALVIKLGKAGVGPHGEVESVKSRSRGSSLSGKKDK